MRTRLIGLAVGLVAFGTFAIPAGAAEITKTASGIVLEMEDLEYPQAGGIDPVDAFSGEVTSSKKACTKSRKVKVFESTVELFSDPIVTDADGHWEAEIEDPGDGTYFAKVAKKKIGSGNHKRLCKAAKSSNLVVDDKVGPVDTDGDTYYTDQDCDDSDLEINPDGTETRDGVDQDCDGLADNLDADADGFATGDDCDDTDSARNPGATETDNGKDDDCDGIGDLGSAVDADGDGISTGTDCDDSDPSVAPGNAETRDGVDEDCDGTSDNLDADADGVNTPEDCDDTDSSRRPNASETLNGEDDDCDGPSDEDFYDAL